MNKNICKKYSTKKKLEKSERNIIQKKNPTKMKQKCVKNPTKLKQETKQQRLIRRRLRVCVDCFCFVFVVVVCLLSFVVVVVCLLSFVVGSSCYMASCLLLGMPRMSLEKGWTAMGADVGVNPADLALPPPLLYPPEAAAEALLAAIIELTPCW